jgi:hypothetical protein
VKAPPPANCPVCNSLQRFSRKQQLIGNRIYVYTRCLTCRTVFPIANYSDIERRAQLRGERDRRRSIRSTHRGRRH